MSADGELPLRASQAPTPPSAARARILFVAENVSLAQVVRLRVLAGALDPEHYQIVFACSAHDPLIFDGTRFERRTLPSMTSAQMLRRMALGLRPYDEGTLARYVRDDLALLEAVQPDLVVSDLRWSLAISAPKLGVRHATLINAYWSPHAARDGFPLPVHPLVRLIGKKRVAPHIDKAMPHVLRHFARPVNALRRRYGLAPLGDLLDVLVAGDHTLYADVPELVPLAGAPPSHAFLGPVLWSPDVPLPRELDRASTHAPLVYVTLGSSGDLRALEAVVRGLARMPVRVLLATAGRFERAALPQNVIATRYAPGSEAARRATLVICNGGSSTGYQALHEGVPVLGLPFNFDQSLSMQTIERAGAGIALSPDSARPDDIAYAATKLLTDERYRTAAQNIGAALRARDAHAAFRSVVERALPARRTARP